MTKDHYFEMCEMMGTEPVEEDIPVEISDFPDEVQTAFAVYQILQDQWDGMSGSYMGKNLVGLGEVFEICQIDKSDRKTILELIGMIDRERADLIAKKREQEHSLESKKSPK